MFDINEYARYYGYLKKAAIACLDYVEFQDFFFLHGLHDFYNKKMFSVEMFNKMKLTLKSFDNDSFYFFEELFSCYSGRIIRERLFDDDESRTNVIKNFNIYLKNENNYNVLKSKIYDFDFKYINGDIFKDKIIGKYDNIFLSNLCTVVNIDKLKKLVKKLDNNNLNKNGSLLLGYLWDIKFDSDSYCTNWIDIYKMPITREKLKKYISEYYNVSDGRDFLFDTCKKNDLVLVYRKK